MQQTSQLPRFLQRATEVGIVLVVLATVILLAAIAFTGSGVEIPTYFTPEEGTYQLTSEGWGSGTLIRAAGLARFDDPSGVLVGLTVGAVLGYVIPGLVILVTLRAVLRTVVAASPFVPGNVARFRWIGWMVVLVGVLSQTLNWIGAWLVEANSTVSGLHLEVRIQPDLAMVFLGLVVLVLAEVFAHGSGLQLDSDLTV